MRRILVLCAAAGLAVASLGAHCDGARRPPGGDPTPEAALARLDARTAAQRNLRGFAGVTGWDAKQTFKGKLLVVAERPAKVHIQVLSPFDQPISYLATDGETLNLYLLKEGRFLTGPATADNLARILPMRIDPAVFVDALLGAPPLPVGGDPAEAERRLTWDPAAGVHVLTYGDRRWPAAWLRPDDLAPTHAGWLAPGENRGWTLELWDHKQGAPHRMAFEHRPSGSGFELTWDQVEFNVPELPAETWRIEIPRGVIPESLSP